MVGHCDCCSLADRQLVLGDTQMMNFLALIGGITIAAAAFRALRHG
jgi:hypothetical protein